MRQAQGPSILSVDLEEYFQAEVFANVLDRGNWGSVPSRLERGCSTLLDLFDECKAKATFFVVAWNAERHPALVREIVRRGHEVACHSYWHRLVYELTPYEFREDTRRAKEILEDICGSAVAGYRAPSFSITAKSLWALPILAEIGFVYDCSVYPIRHDIYGIPEAPRHPFRLSTDSGDLLEFPMPTLCVAGRINLPAAGGGYLRILPYWYTRIAMREFRREGLPVVVYVHPWEVDLEQPRVRLPLVSRLRHYTNLSHTAKRLRLLLQSGDFVSFHLSGLLDSDAFEKHAWNADAFSLRTEWA